jgi:hypothetical protein
MGGPIIQTNPKAFIPEPKNDRIVRFYKSEFDTIHTIPAGLWFGLLNGPTAFSIPVWMPNLPSRK